MRTPTIDTEWTLSKIVKYGTGWTVDSNTGTFVLHAKHSSLPAKTAFTREELDDIDPRIVHVLNQMYSHWATDALQDALVNSYYVWTHPRQTLQVLGRTVHWTKWGALENIGSDKIALNYTYIDSMPTAIASPGWIASPLRGESRVEEDLLYFESQYPGFSAAYAITREFDLTGQAQTDYIMRHLSLTKNRQTRKATTTLPVELVDLTNTGFNIA